MLMYINSSYGLIRGGGGSIRSKIDFTIFLKCRIKFFFVPQQLKICTNLHLQKCMAVESVTSTSCDINR